MIQVSEQAILRAMEDFSFTRLVAIRHLTQRKQLQQSLRRVAYDKRDIAVRGYA